MAIITYCDLCGLVIKGNNYHSLYCTSPDSTTPDPTKYDDQEKYLKDYARYLIRLSNDVKEICPTCKHIFDKIFELRLVKLSELTEEIITTYNLKSKNNPKERKNGKEKK